jgi:hypothetical protein
VANKTLTPYLITAHRAGGATTHRAATEESALKIMDRLYDADIRYEGRDANGKAVDENSLTDIIEARPQRPSR